MRNLVIALLALAMFSCAHSAHAQKKLIIIGSSTSACYNLVDPTTCYVKRIEAYYNTQAPNDTTIDNGMSKVGYNCYRGMPTSYVPPYTDPAGSHAERHLRASSALSTPRNTGSFQRGGTPVAYDRVLGTRFGVEAIAAADEGDFGKMVALRGTEIVRVPLEEALAEPKLLDPRLYETAEVFFG